MTETLAPEPDEQPEREPESGKRFDVPAGVEPVEPSGDGTPAPDADLDGEPIE